MGHWHPPEHWIWNAMDNTLCTRKYEIYALRWRSVTGFEFRQNQQLYWLRFIVIFQCPSRLMTWKFSYNRPFPNPNLITTTIPSHSIPYDRIQFIYFVHAYRTLNLHTHPQTSKMDALKTESALVANRTATSTNLCFWGLLLFRRYLQRFSDVYDHDMTSQ
jgi:hypothetical protein